MPTSRGWLVALLGAVSLMASRGFGALALGQVGFALIVLVAGAVMVVRAGRHDLRPSRTLQPLRVTAGKRVEVSIQLDNLGRGSAPLVLIEDRIPAQLGRRARFAFGGIERRGRRRASYELRPSLRGRYRIGPLDISYLDPFSLAARRISLGEASDLLVHPKIEELVLPSDLGERRSLTASALRRPTGTEGEDFYTLREYIEGDDLRKIHWPSTARKNRFMIRQEETPWHNRATIVLDDRRAAHLGSAESFESGVEAAASVVSLYHRSGFSFRLVGAHEPGLPSRRGSEHYGRCLDLLATIGLRSPGESGTAGDDPLLLARLAELEARQTAEGTLVLAGGDITPEIAVALAHLRRRFRQVVVLSFPSHRYGTADTRARWAGEKETLDAVRLLARSAVRTIVLGPGDHLQSAWSSLARSTTGGERHWQQRHAPV